MKRLSLLRHAKSSWNEAYKDDFDRPLNQRGRQAAPIIGDYINDHIGRPDLILCSAAMRTRETQDLILPFFTIKPETKISKDLYLASPTTILSHVSAAAEQYSHIMVIAHNPGLHMLALDLADTARSRSGDLQRLARKFPTAALAHYEFISQNWRSSLTKKGALRAFVTPKDLDNND